MAEIIHTHDDMDSRGSGAALGVILGILLVLALLVGGWWLFFRQPAVVPVPQTETNIQQNTPPPVQQAPEGDTNINVNPGAGTDQGGDTTTSP